MERTHKHKQRKNYIDSKNKETKGRKFISFQLKPNPWQKPTVEMARESSESNYQVWNQSNPNKKDEQTNECKSEPIKHTQPQVAVLFSTMRSPKFKGCPDSRWSGGDTWRKRGSWRCKWWPTMKGFRLIRPAVTDQRLGVSKKDWSSESERGESE